MEPEELKTGDRILFNDRKMPVEVEAVDENRIHLKGPQGGEYVIFRSEEEDLLVRNKRSSTKYASYVENLRKVGKWERDGNLWRHSKSGARIELRETETGFWTLETDLDIDLELPKYGFSEREFAEEEAEKIMERNPEG